MKIAPSILSADFGRLREEIEKINESEADLFHVDVMDGRFVPNISFGFPVLDVVKKYAAKPIDVHLMIVEPEKYVDRFISAGADFLSFHVEACPHSHRLLHQIKQKGVKAGIAINPQTAVSSIVDLAEDMDFINIMSVNPGFGGQSFIPNTLHKVSTLAALRIEKNHRFEIEIDGGVNAQNINQLQNYGADIAVAGNFLFASDNFNQAIANLKTGG